MVPPAGLQRTRDNASQFNKRITSSAEHNFRKVLADNG